ncbi:MAG: ethanolamine ammonia-lyase subunit EutC [Pirellulaceae bacterium]|nr:ethanolamine ammonia-lyase subunit EutC [Pirellulaceae bacterium]MDP7016399.1 ethanolamine ammonia-lyase subunit EutC [Pirellulaceae bacterium]
MVEERDRSSLARRGVSADTHRDLQSVTPARIALGRCGGSAPTDELLKFSLAHARACDAVNEPFDGADLAAQLAEQLRDYELPVLCGRSRAASLAEFLRRPDLGRRLAPDDRSALGEQFAGSHDLVIAVSNGLSAIAAQRHAAPLLKQLVGKLRDAAWNLAPLVVVENARVAIEDEIGEISHSRIALILLGERPGLGSPDSLGAYFVHGPRIGRTDADRNCVSNIRPAGQPPSAAAETLLYLLNESRRRKLSGVELKDSRSLPNQHAGDGAPPAALDPPL